jgi:hypothetical protein
VTDYQTFLASKRHTVSDSGVSVMPDAVHPKLFDWQKQIVLWALRKGQSAIFADCGLGKTPMQLEWARLVSRSQDKPVLILAPLAVAPQTVREAEKFGIEVQRSAGEINGRILVTNYEKLHHFHPSDFSAVVCDESSILKSFDGTRRQQITEFMRRVPYRLLCTATAAPNDYIELGTSSECLGNLGYTDMLGRFFINDQRVISPMTYRHRGQDYAAVGEKAGWRFKGHAEEAFWRWVCSWARALRKPSDIGYDDDGFILPKLTEAEIVVKARSKRPDLLFEVMAVGFHEEREVTRRTINERCEIAAEKVNGTGQPAVVWCHLNDEADTLVKMCPGAEQVSGADSDERKEAKFEAFRYGNLRVLIIKPKIGAYGLNWQHCSHVVYFVSHSYEQYYQAVRRCWRFGQTRPVTVDIIRTEAQERVMQNLKRKSDAADRMFVDLVNYMNNAMKSNGHREFNERMEVPSWL